ncbi:MAG: LacI family transcriptional regulator, partial [Candidatus Accumulibacter sp.]|nr:LacI family transcriptional regulator [Accumulibacter sp.]
MPESKMQRVTIQHVAKAAGVSVSSVSHYQNGRRHHLRPETIERIKKSIEELGYSPSRIARQLKSGQTPMVGLLIPSIDNPYHAELALVLDCEAQKAGFRPVLGNGQRDAVREKAFIDELIEYGMRGFISTSELRDTTAMGEYVRRGIAFVLFDLRLSDIGFDGVDVVSIDNCRATSMAVDHLAALGHRRIAYVTATPLSANRAARLDGYTMALERNGLGAPIVISIKDDGNSEAGDSGLAGFGEKAAEKLLRSYPEVTAAIGINSIVTLGLCAGLQQLGVEVPRDISLIGIDNIKFSSMMVPSITTLGADYSAMAAQAIDYLRTRLA